MTKKRKLKLPHQIKREDGQKVRPIHPRNSWMKPKRFQDYFTLTELSWEVDRDVSWVRKLEKQGRIPRATRHKIGELHIRLWSPEQVEEIRTIIHEIKKGRPPK